MKKFLKIIFLITLTSLSACGWFAQEAGPNKAPVSEPEPVRFDDWGKAYYNPESPSDAPDMGDTPDAGTTEAKKCVVDSVVKETRASDVDKHLIDFIYEVVNIVEEIDLDPQDTVDNMLLQADHVHIQSAVIKSTHSLDFIDWVRVCNPETCDNPSDDWAWAREFGAPKDKALNVDGSIDLAPYIKEGMTLRSKVRAKSPNGDARVAGIIRLQVWHQCE